VTCGFVIGIATPYTAPTDLLPRLLFALLLWGVPLLLTFWLTAPDEDRRLIAVALLATGLLGHGLQASGVAGPLAWALAFFVAGALLWGVPVARRHARIHGLRTTQAFGAMCVVLWALAAYAKGDAVLWRGFGVIAILVVANVIKMAPSIATAVVIHRLKSDTANYWYRVMFVVPMIIPGMVYLLLWKFFFEPASIFNKILDVTGIKALLVFLDTQCFQWGLFVAGENPVWLGNPDLVLPAFIIWGFPWVGVVGVLIYLAGLQSISESVYEAADLDGVTALGKFLHIELPLILTQVRINLVLMIIGTLQMYGFVLVLFGDGGGPNGRLMVPGLYMFRSAFREGYAGYACCIGLIIFCFILILTEVNNRYIRVEK
jgi:raffinose/stachyose/melibiose transport system permease protein